MQSKMMAYDRVIADLNSARLRGTSYPVIHALMKASLTVAGADVRTNILFLRIFCDIKF